MKDFIISLGIGHFPGCYAKTGTKGLKTSEGIIVEEYDLNKLFMTQLYNTLNDVEGIKCVWHYGPNAKHNKSLKARTDSINKSKASLSISGHHDWNGNNKMRGATIYYWGKNSKTYLLSKAIRKNIKEARGVMSLIGNGIMPCSTKGWPNFHMIREPKCHSLLIEFGFFSNAEDRVFTKSYQYRIAICNAIKNAICTRYGITQEENEVKKVTLKSYEEILKECTYEPGQIPALIDVLNKYQLNSDVQRLINNIPLIIQKVYYRDKELGK